MENIACTLQNKTCQPCEGGTSPLGQNEIDRLLPGLVGWQQVGQEISKCFRFANYYETMAFVNATAWLSHRENHHPDLEVAYRQCVVHYSTHAIGGLSENDFICAAKVDRLFNDRSAESEH